MSENPQVKFRQIVAEVSRALSITPVEAYQLLAEVRYDYTQRLRLYQLLAEVRFDLAQRIFATQMFGEVRYDLVQNVFATNLVGEVCWTPHETPVVGGIYLYDCAFERPAGIALSACTFERPAGIVTGGAKYG